VSFGYSIDKTVIQVLNEKKFTVSAEIVPPRNGEEQAQTFVKLKSIIDSGVDFLSVTKGAGGSLRGGSLPIAQLIKEQLNRPCIAHFTCRDLVPEEVENQLMDHHYFGIRNILALRGDPPMGQTDWKPREGGYSYAYELVKHIGRLNRGEFLKRQGFEVSAREKTQFCIGVAAYPEHTNAQERREFNKMKFDAGAEYAITQMLFDPDKYEIFLNELRQMGFPQPILPGLRILKSKKQAKVMEQRFQCSVPDWYMHELPEEGDKTTTDNLLQPFFRLVESLKKIGAHGVHLFVLADTAINCEAIVRLSNKQP
jgi:methylenetetrahydrofolate reductase (NADPH)